MFCPNCGATLEDDSKFCIMCGAAIEYENIVRVKKFSPKVAIVGCCCIAMIGILIWIVSVIVNKPNAEELCEPTYQQEDIYEGKNEYKDEYATDEPEYEQQVETKPAENTLDYNSDENLDWVEDRYRLEDFLYTSFDESEFYMFGELLSKKEDEFLMGTTYEFEHGSIGVSSDGEIVSIVAEDDIEGIAMVMNVSIRFSADDIFSNMGNEYATEERDEKGNAVYGYYSPDGTFFVKFHINKDGQCVQMHVFDPYL